MNECREMGMISFRSAGSHSPIDVVAIDHVNKKIDLFQCKPDSYTERDIEREVYEKCPQLRNLKGTFQVNFEVI